MAATDIVILQRDGSNRFQPISVTGSSNTNAILGFDGSGIFGPLTSFTITTANVTTLNAAAVKPATDDGAALGDTTHNFSDLFLATGAVINYQNGNVAITHSSGILTMGTGEMRITTPGTNSASVVTVGGSQTLTSKVLTAATITTSLVPTSNDGAALGSTSNSFSDLFLATGALVNIANGNWVATHTSGILTVTTGDLRVTSANVGTNADSVPTLSSTSTFTNKTLTSPTLTTPAAFTTGGTITLAENTSIALDPAGSADGKYSGITVAGTGGATIAFGDLVTLDKDDSRWELVDISVAAAATGDARGILGMAVTSSTDGGALTVLLQGIIRADANFPTLTIGAEVFASTTGDITSTQPTTTDHVIRRIGAAMTADELYFSPAYSWYTHT